MLLQKDHLPKSKNNDHGDDQNDVDAPCLQYKFHHPSIATNGIMMKENQRRSSTTTQESTDESVGKYGCEDAAPDVHHHDFASYGAFSLAPDVACKRSSTTTQDSIDDSIRKYGYEDAVPDSDNSLRYQHHDFASYGAVFSLATSQRSTTSIDDSIRKYGYGDAAPDSSRTEDSDDEDDEDDDDDVDDYVSHTPEDEEEAKIYHGYGDMTSPTPSKQTVGASFSSPVPRRSSLSSPMPRRSSLKQPGSSPRRSSLQMADGPVPDLAEHGDVCSPRPVRRRSSLTFADTVRMKIIQPTKSMTKDEGSSLFLKRQDMKKIKQDAKNIAAAANNGDIEVSELEESGRESLRGLERYSKKEGLILTQRRDKAWDCVLDEQDRQYYAQMKKSSFDSITQVEEKIAKMYKRLSITAKMEAKDRAIKDQEEIKNYLKTTRKYCRRLSM